MSLVTSRRCSEAPLNIVPPVLIGFQLASRLRGTSLVSIADTAWLRVFSPPISVIERPIYALA
jgi:hypothetical protein